jgi:GGDEF domain-containing protein
VCEAIVRALGDETDLRRIERGGALELLVSRIGELTGVSTVDATLRAVEALHGVIWSGLRDELIRPDADQMSELAERLALVIEQVRGAALRHLAGERIGGSPVAMPEAAREQVAAEGDGEVRVAADEPLPNAGMDEPLPPNAGMEIHEALWVGAMEDEIARSERTGSPLALLLAELEDADRVLAVEPRDDAIAMFGRFAQGVRSVMRRHDILACETETRAWIIARDTGRIGAQVLGARIASAVSSTVPWRGAPMSVSVGVAVLGEDGQDAESLIEAAEEAKFAASASGIAIVRAVPQENEGDPPPGSAPPLAG